VWLNGPYDDLRPWVTKLIKEIKAGRVTSAIMLSTNATHTAWFHLAFQAAASVCFPHKTIRFLDDKGVPMRSPSPWGSSFFYFGDNVELFEKVFCKIGNCVPGKQIAPVRKYPMDDKEILRRASVINLERAKARRSQLNKTIQTQEFPDGKHYTVILADPAWDFTINMSPSRRIDNHYPTMPLADICKLPVGNITTSSAILFLWVPISFVPEGLDVCKAWGFDYKTQIAWVKDRPGMGFYVRGMHELLFIATKGAPLVPEPADRPESVLTAPRRAHSEKPHVHGIIEKMYPGFNRIELFARNPRRGWDAWGNEGVGKSRLKFQSV
jgi:N6-adenosine-specific RNA methylase IME4